MSKKGKWIRITTAERFANQPYGSKPCPRCVHKFMKWQRRKRPNNNVEIPIPEKYFHFEETVNCRNCRAVKNASGADRRARKEKKTPRWANMGEIRNIYRMASQISKASGIPHHVDHIIPLGGGSVSGLHVHNNLRIIPGKQNIRKSNKWDWHKQTGDF